MSNVPAALPASLQDNQVLTFKQWIALNNISARTGRRILAASGGPIVKVANNRAWQASRARAL